MTEHGGSLGGPGCVAWIFEKRGMIIFDRDKVDEDKLLDVALEAGAEDVKEEETEFEVIIVPSKFEAVKKAFDDRNMVYSVAEVSMVPQNTVKLEGRKAEQMVNLMEALEENDDVNNVYANFDIPDKVMEAIS